MPIKLPPNPPRGTIINGTSLDDILSGTIGNDTIRGWEGSDTLDYEGVSAALSVNLTTGIATGEGTDAIFEMEDIWSGSGNDTLIGNSVSNWIDGNAGNDFIDAGGGDDWLEGGAGNDTMRGGIGEDLVYYGKVNVALNVNLTSGVATGEGVDLLIDIENIRGGSGNDTLIGNSVPNWIRGELGNDSIAAGGGDDWLEGGGGNDTMRGGAGEDWVDYEGVGAALSVNLVSGIATGEGVDLLFEIENICAGSGNDTLVCNSVSNDIEGGLGNDIVDAGLGNDTLSGCFYGANGGRSEIDAITGGVGNDIFQLGWASGQFYDDGNTGNAGRGDYVLINDFTVGQDKLQLDGSAANYYLGASGVTGVSGIGLYAEQGTTDELIAIIRSANTTALNDANTVKAAIFV